MLCRIISWNTIGTLQGRDDGTGNQQDQDFRFLAASYS